MTPISDDMVERGARILLERDHGRAAEQNFGDHFEELLLAYSNSFRLALTAALEGSVAVPEAELKRLRDDLEDAQIELRNIANMGMRAWQPIETAPKDGIAVLLWVPENKCTYCAYWRSHVVEPEVAGWHIFAGGWRAQLQWATLWQPVPTPSVTRNETTPAAPKP